jgi:hypothetical protein
MCDLRAERQWTVHRPRYRVCPYHRYSMRICWHHDYWERYFRTFVTGK